MMRRLTVLSVVLVLGALAVQPAAAVVEKKTGTEYPDALEAGCGGATVAMQATGVGLREKTFMKVDVYTIVSYIQEGVDLGDAPAATLVKLQQPKRLQMDLRRGFSREKLINAFVEVIEKNYEDRSAFAADMETFKAYFTRDAAEGDVIVFDFCPGTGLTTTLNGEETGVIANTAFAEALWSVWFGEKPANKGLREALLSSLAP
jgi:hypothetical protein